MKVLLLAGGFGTRLSEYTETIPKPMVEIGNKPILWHIMNTYAHYGHNDFYVALGYKGELIKKYFLNYRSLNSNFSINLNTGKVDIYESDEISWKVTLVDTGIDSMTGGRLKRLKPFVDNEPVLLTYGDGLSDININNLIKFHKSHGKLVTVTAVRPSARFGELSLDGEKVSIFQEKPHMNSGWINGGYFVIQPEFFSFIENDLTVLEKEPLEKLANMGELMAFHHNGFWQCMDTKRDKDLLENLWQSGKAPWKC